MGVLLEVARVLEQLGTKRKAAFYLQQAARVCTTIDERQAAHTLLLRVAAAHNMGDLCGGVCTCFCLFKRGLWG